MSPKLRGKPVPTPKLMAYNNVELAECLRVLADDLWVAGHCYLARLIAEAANRIHVL